MEEILHKYGKYPIIYRVLYIPGGVVNIPLSPTTVLGFTVIRIHVAVCLPMGRLLPRIPFFQWLERLQKHTKGGTESFVTWKAKSWSFTASIASYIWGKLEKEFWRPKNDVPHSPEVTIRTCQEAARPPKGNTHVAIQVFQGAMFVSREGKNCSLRKLSCQDALH